MKKQKITQFALAIMLMSFFSCNMGTNKEGKPDSNPNNKKGGEPVKDDVEPCILCNEKDDYTITRTDFERLLIAFDTKFVTPGTFANNGGVIVLEDDSKTSPFPIAPYPTFKLHMGLEKDGESNRLLVTYEPRSSECNGTTYQGVLGIQAGTNFLGSYKDNDIVFNKQGAKQLTPKNINDHFFSKTPMRIVKDKKNLYDNTVAQGLLNTFKALDTKGELHQCDDIMFNLDRTLSAITAVSKRSAFQYYFGFDDTMTLHKIRLIIVGIDKNDQLAMYDATGDYLMREASRPKP